MNNWLVMKDKTTNTLHVIHQEVFSCYYDGALLHKADCRLEEVARFINYEKAEKYFIEKAINKKP